MTFAYWRKCDFQVHTPRDPNWQGPRPVGLGEDNGGNLATIADVDASRGRWADDFIEQCARRGLAAIALTDHHEMVMVPYVQAAIEARRAREPQFDLWLFPGMELTCRNGVQCLIIFDADLSKDWREAAQARLGILVASLNDGARQGPAVTQLQCSYPEIPSLLDDVPELKGRYIVLPNVSDGSRFSVATNGAHADFRQMPYVGGYLDVGQTIETLGNRVKRRLSGNDVVWGTRFIYPLPTSDSRNASYEKLGSNDCWIKLANQTAEAIRQAFLGHQSRISIQAPLISSLCVKSLTVQGSLILSDGELAISPELNSLIGGRGSGKSTLLEYIAYGLGRSCVDIDKPDYSGNERLTSLIRDTLTTPGGTLELAIVQDGATFYIRRGGATSYVPKITYPDGSSQELPTKELRSLFPAVVYSQGELAEIGKQAGKRSQLSDLLQFVQPEFKREDERLGADIENAKLAIRKAVQALSSAWTQQAQIHKLQTTKSSLEQRIAALQKTLPQLPESDQQIIARFDALVELDAKRQQAERQAQSVMDDLTELWRTSREPIDLTSPLPEAAAMQSAYGAFTSEFASGVKTFGTALASHRDNVVTSGKQIIAALEVAKLARDQAMEKLTAHRSVTAQITKLQEELQLLLAQIGELNATRISADDKFIDLQTATKALQDTVAERAAKTKEWADKIEALSNRRIEAQLNVDGNWSEIFEAVDVLSAKTGSQEATRHQQLSERLEKDGVWPFLDALRGDCLAALRWKYVSQSSAGDKPTCTAMASAIGATERSLTNCFELIDLQRVEAIATASPKPDITLYYCDDGRKISFEKASEGQRAAALLLMLLEQPGGPLLIDQPEGDLDNKVVSELTEKLHTAKRQRQIIFASHNANIVVNGSSELVVGMGVTDDAKRAIACSGAIDREDVCSVITETMEGGEKAFRDRKDKYGY
jgi:chromosome segregation protein